MPSLPRKTYACKPLMLIPPSVVESVPELVPVAVATQAYPLTVLLVLVGNPEIAANENPEPVVVGVANVIMLFSVTPTTTTTSPVCQLKDPVVSSELDESSQVLPDVPMSVGAAHVVLDPIKL